MAQSVTKGTHPQGEVEYTGIKTGVFKTAGGVITPIEGLSNDAGLGKPPTVSCYGKPTETAIPDSGKEGGGTNRAIKAFFKGMGGGKP